MYPANMMDSILHDEFDRKKFLENSLGLVRCMKTLLDGMAEDQAIAIVLKHLEELMPVDDDNLRILRMYAAWTIPLLCNVLWEQVDGEKAAASVEAVAMQAVAPLERRSLPPYRRAAFSAAWVQRKEWTFMHSAMHPAHCERFCSPAFRIDTALME